MLDPGGASQSTERGGTVAPINDVHPPRLAAGVALAVLLGSVAAVSFLRAIDLDYDFHYFYLDAAYVWRHGALNPELPDTAAAMDSPENRDRRQLPFYLPVVPLILAPLAAGGVVPAAIAWTLLHVVSLGCAVRTLGRRAGAIPTTVGVALALPAIFEAARFNQLSFLVLALVVCGVDGVLCGRRVRGGALLGVAVLLKLLPGVFLFWLVLKREWRGLAAATGVAAVLAIAPCLAFFGPQRTIEYHRQWIQYNAGTLAHGHADETRREHFTDYRNQSIAAVVARNFWPEHRFRVPSQLLQLSREACAAVAIGVAGLLGAALLWAARWPLARLSIGCLRGEAAAFALAMLIFSPLLRQYYLIWALPALLILVGAVRNAGGAARVLGTIGVAVWITGMLAWLSPVARAYGAHLGMLLVLAVIVLRMGGGPPAPRLRSEAKEDCP